MVNLNIHLHALVLDGVFTNDGGSVRADQLVALSVSLYSFPGNCLGGN